MPIVAVCGQCSKRYTLDDKFAGRRIKCRTCNGKFVVPAEEPTLVNADESALSDPTPTPTPPTPAPDPEPVEPAAPPARDEDVLELRTEFKERAQMATVSEDRDEESGAETRSLKRGGRGTDPKRRSRYKRKSRWKLKAIVGVVVILGLGIGAGMMFAPKNMARKWEQTKAFWGTGFLGWCKEMISFDMSLEAGAKDVPEGDGEELETPAGPPAGSDVVVRGTITSVEPGVAGRDPRGCSVETADGTYRVMLAEASERLAEIASALKEGEDGPTVEVRGVLAKNGQDKNLLTQVDAPELTEVEAGAIEGKSGFEVLGGDGASDEGGEADAGETDDADEGSVDEDPDEDEDAGNESDG